MYKEVKSLIINLILNHNFTGILKAVKDEDVERAKKKSLKN